ncbi:MAG TPA: hypothetical protein VIK89_10950 [Cytophagaceae bacterium]
MPSKIDLKKIFFEDHTISKFLIWGVIPPIASILAGEFTIVPGLVFGLCFLIAHFKYVKHFILSFLFLLVSLMAYQVVLQLLTQAIYLNKMSPEVALISGGLIFGLILVAGSMVAFSVKNLFLYGPLSIIFSIVGVYSFFYFARNLFYFNIFEPGSLFIAFITWQLPVFISLSYLIDPVVTVKKSDVRDKPDRNKKRRPRS